jgi:hypothetical protein
MRRIVSRIPFGPGGRFIAQTSTAWRAKPGSHPVYGFAILLAAAPAHAQSVVVSWIQLGPGSTQAARAAGSYGDDPTNAVPTILARTIIEDGACPSITLDDSKTLPMSLRFAARLSAALPGKPTYFVDPAQTEPARFPDGTPKATTAWAECEAVVPPGHATALIAGTRLKLPVQNPKRVLVVGDTGCRNARQTCANPMAFPAAYLANVEAGYAPDLIVHVGDYLYREAPGADPAEAWGDGFDGWNADVFFPLKPLLQAAPIVLTRGNHESCGRGARGWYALLDPHPFDATKMACPKTAKFPAPSGGGPSYTADFEPAYRISAGGINFLVHDSSFAQDISVDSNVAQNYDLDLSKALAAIGPTAKTVFVTHRPSFAMVSAKSLLGTRSVQNVGNATEQAVFSGGTNPASAFSHGVPGNIFLFLSGHVHEAQYVNLQDSGKYPPQLIVGMSGTLLDADLNTGKVPAGNADVPAFTENSSPFQVATFAGAPKNETAKTAGAHDEFGFAVLEATSDGRAFNAQIYKLGTSKAGTCRILVAPRSIDCDF